MDFRRIKKCAWILPVAYAVAFFSDVCLGEAEAPAPGSAGDTLTVEDKRMAYLVYNLLDSNGMILGADTARGRKLFFRNCAPCHGRDGRRMNLSHDLRNPQYIGTTAHDEAPTFWYMMNFGNSIRGMLPYFDEIPLSEMIDIAGFAQTLPRHPWTREEMEIVDRENEKRKAERERLEKISSENSP